jgi:hypothetical protein
MVILVQTNLLFKIEAPSGALLPAVFCYQMRLPAGVFSRME